MTIKDPTDVRNEFASTFERQADPLAEYSSAFYDAPDPFEYFIDQSVRTRETIDSQVTIDYYHRTYR